MPTLDLCAECGAELTGKSTRGYCTRCLFNLGLAVGDDIPPVPPEVGPDPSDGPRDGSNEPLSQAPSPAAPHRFGDYELLEQIARGGMATVFKARHVRLNRLVALKLVGDGLPAPRELIERFKVEAEAVAGLHHPNIVPLHEVGECDGRHFFSMPLFEGQTLAHALRGKSMPVDSAVRILITLARAVHFAHQRGVLHRDLKPGNILLDDKGEPHLTDFGVAKLIEKDSALTRTHAVLGTPNYMSPEQGRGDARAVTTASDVYGLGAVFYELLAGVPPFSGGTPLEIIRRVLEAEPRRPSIHNRDVDPDLETVCLKCLEKEPSRRYGSALSVAEDLERWQRHEPIAARPVAPWEKAQKWVRRKPAIAASLGLGLTLLVVLAIGGPLAVWRIADARDAERQVRKQAEARAYASDMNLAEEALRQNNLDRALELLNRHRPAGSGEFAQDPRGWEWRYLWQQCQSEAQSVVCIRSNGIASLSISHDGRWLAVGEEEGGELTVWDLQTRQQIAHLHTGQSGGVAVAFSPREPLLAFAESGGASGQHSTNRLSIVRLWNPETRQETGRFPVSYPRPEGTSAHGRCIRLAFSPDGRSVMTMVNTWYGGPLWIWSALDGSSQRELPMRHYSMGFGIVSPFAVDQSMSVVARGIPGGAAGIDDFVTGTNRWRIPAEAEEITTLALSPNGRLLATSAGYATGLIRLWDVERQQEIARLEGHRGWVSDLVFWADGATLASASGDQTIRIWNLTDPGNVPPPRVLRGHQAQVWRLALLPDQRTLVSGGRDGSVLTWDTQSPPRPSGRFTLPGQHADVRFAPKGGSLLTVDASGGAVRRWHGPDYHTNEVILNVGTDYYAALIAEDHRLIATGSGGGRIAVWDVSRRSLVCEFMVPGEAAHPVRFLDKGRTLIVTPVHSDRVHQWDLNAVREVASWQVGIEGLGLSFSTDERWSLGFRSAGNHVLRDRRTGSERSVALDISMPMDSKFSPDGSLVAASSWMGWVKLWEWPSLRESGVLSGFLQGVVALAFSPDGRRLIAGSHGNEAVTLWDVDSRLELLTLDVAESIFGWLQISPDGNLIAAISMMGTGAVHIWRAPSWEEIEAHESQP